MSSDLLSFFGWTFLPDLITSNLQSLYYKLVIRVGDPVPQPSSPTHTRHRQRIYISVILIYLLYTLYEAHWEIRREGDFYQALGVPHDVQERALQSRFRRLTLQYHPDKLPATASPIARQQAEQIYLHLQLAKDTLVDSTKRFAYDRFGPTVTQLQHTTTIRDYVWHGLRGIIPFYIGSYLVLNVLAWMGFGDWGKYWRFLALLCLATLELHTITRPNFTWITQIPVLPSYLFPKLNALLSALPFPLHLVSNLFDAITRLTTMILDFFSIPHPATSTLLGQTPYLPFQALRVAHRAAIAFFIALSRLGPIIASSMRAGEDEEDGAEGETSEAATQAAFSRLENAVATTNAESVRLLALELVPFRSRQGLAASLPNVQSKPGPDMDFLKAKIKDWFVTNTIRSDSLVREAVAREVDSNNNNRDSGPGQ